MQMASKTIITFDHRIDLDGVFDQSINLPALRDGTFKKVRSFLEENALYLGDEKNMEVGCSTEKGYGGAVFAVNSYQNVLSNSSRFLLNDPALTVVRFTYQRPEDQWIRRFGPNIYGILGYARPSTSCVIETLSRDAPSLHRVTELVRQSIDEESLEEIHTYLQREGDLIGNITRWAKEAVDSLTRDQIYSDADEQKRIFKRFLGNPEESRKNLRDINLRPILYLGRKYELENVVNRTTSLLESLAERVV